MMPIFFHSQAHIWIFYTLFVNGFLINRILLEYSTQYKELNLPFEAQVIMSFAVSLAINGVLLLGLDLANLPFSAAVYPLVTLSCILVGLVIWQKLYLFWPVEINWFALPLYVAMFVILFYNGGMIDQISDAWWHMSKANKIGWASSFSLEYGHLNGVSDRYYPPLWHANLALLRELSNQGLPILWNAFTAWGGVLKLMAYFLLGSVLFKDKKIGLLGAVLFALLPGVGNSYMRVSAWPSHLAYVLWFFSIALAFRIIHEPKVGLTHLKGILANYVSLLVLALCLFVMFYLHQFEVLLFAVGLFMYLLGLSVCRVFSSTPNSFANPPLFSVVYRVGLISLIALSTLYFIQHDGWKESLDSIIVMLMPIVIFIGFLIADLYASTSKIVAKLIIFTVLLLIVLSINYTHFLSLFMPELALPNGASGERPLVAEGVFGGTLGLPGWHLQLRAGLLWSGVVAAIIGVVMALLRPSPAWVFVAVNCCFVWILCTSPYFYEWVSDVLAYHSAWRFAILSLHPLIIAAALLSVWAGFKLSLVEPGVFFREKKGAL